MPPKFNAQALKKAAVEVAPVQPDDELAVVAPSRRMAADQVIDIVEAAGQDILEEGKVDYNSMTYVQFLERLQTITTAEVKNKKHVFRSEKPLQSFLDGAGGYEYTVMLKKIFDIIREKNPDHSEVGHRNQIIVPDIQPFGSKKNVITNFGAVCESIGRPLEAVKDFLDKEMSTVSSIDSNNCLILQFKRLREGYVKDLLGKYMDAYVLCNSCQKIDTVLSREPGRLMVLKCNNCNATRTVQIMGSATYQAVTGKRFKARLAALTNM